MEDVVQSILDSVKFCPCLLLGKYSNDFKKQFKGTVHVVYNINDVKELVENYSGKKGDKHFVIDGVGFLNEQAQQPLLKFIEESTLPIVLLSYFDSVSPIIMSRMMCIYKDSGSHTPKSLTNFVRIGDCFDELSRMESEDGGLSFRDRIKYYSENCPLGYYLESKYGRYDSLLTKIGRILSKIG